MLDEDEQSYGERPEVTTDDTQVVRGADGPPQDQSVDPDGTIASPPNPWAVRGDVRLPEGYVDPGDVEPNEVTVERDSYPSTTPEGAETSSSTWDPAADSHVEVTVRVGERQLIVRQEYPTGDRDELEVLRKLTQLVEPYIEDGSV
jgi:hypothetical protein